MFSVSCLGDDGASVFRIRLSVITDERTTTAAHEPARRDLITLTTGNKKQPTRRRRGIRAQLPRDSREGGQVSRTLSSHSRDVCRQKSFNPRFESTIASSNARLSTGSKQSRARLSGNRVRSTTCRTVLALVMRSWTPARFKLHRLGQKRNHRSLLS